MKLATHSRDRRRKSFVLLASLSSLVFAVAAMITGPTTSTVAQVNPSEMVCDSFGYLETNKVDWTGPQSTQAHNAPVGQVVESVCINSGQSAFFDNPESRGTGELFAHHGAHGGYQGLHSITEDRTDLSAYGTAIDGNPNVPGNYTHGVCYTVQGIGTASVTITETGVAGCKDISHTAVKYTDGDERMLTLLKSEENDASPDAWTMTIQDSSDTELATGPGSTGAAAQVVDGQTYRISESAHEGWVLGSVQCVDQSDNVQAVSPDQPFSRLITISPAAAGDITCTFVNEPNGVVAPTGNIRLEKVDAAGVPIAWVMTVTGPSFALGQQCRVPAVGRNLDGIEPGVYVVSEAPVTGWSVVNVIVNGESQGALAIVKADVLPGETTVVRFANRLHIPTATPTQETPTPTQATPTPTQETPTPTQATPTPTQMTPTVTPTQMTPTPPPSTPTPTLTPTPEAAPGVLEVRKVITNPEAEGASPNDLFDASVNGTVVSFSVNQPASLQLDAGQYTVVELLDHDDEDYCFVSWAVAENGVCPATATATLDEALVTVAAGETTILCFYNTRTVEEVAGDITTPIPPVAGIGLPPQSNGTGNMMVLVLLGLSLISGGAAILATFGGSPRK